MANFISDESVDKALHWLIQHASDAAGAKADRIHVEAYSKVLLSQIMKEHPDLSVAAQEREAYADPRYIEHLKALRDAVERDCKMQFLRSACEAKLEAWRTMSATERAMKI